MKRLFAKPVVAAAAVAALATAGIAAEDRVLDFPADYRAAFTQYYSNDRLLNEDQTITLYANAAALEAARAGSPLPSGAVLVAEIFAAQKDADGDIAESALGHRIPGVMKAIAVMERRDGWDAQYPADLKVGNWEFELFSPAGQNLGKDTTACRECHHPLQETDFLFSIEHLAAAK